MDLEKFLKVQYMILSVFVSSILVTDIVVLIVSIIQGNTWYPYLVFLLAVIIFFVMFSNLIVSADMKRKQERDKKSREAICRNEFFVQLLREQGLDPFDDSIAIKKLIDGIQEKIKIMEVDTVNWEEAVEILEMKEEPF